MSRIVLTASGGPFRGRTKAELADVTVDDALAHPTWSMGPKITVDSSTLMNKGLEVIEAHELFGVALRPHRGGGAPPVDRALDGRVHRRRHDRPALAARHAAARSATPWPTRTGSATPFGRIDWADLGRLDFEPPDHEAFPCLGLAYEAGRLGETAPAWLNAANEVAVAAFLDGRIGWIAIPDVLTEVLSRHDGGTADDVRRRQYAPMQPPGPSLEP